MRGASHVFTVVNAFSSPFSGTFFQLPKRKLKQSKIFASFRPLSRGLFFNMGGSLHQALSFGDEMPIFPGRAGIGGDLQ